MTQTANGYTFSILITCTYQQMALISTLVVDYIVFLLVIPSKTQYKMYCIQSNAFYLFTVYAYDGTGRPTSIYQWQSRLRNKH